MLNREIYNKLPSENRLVNNGVAEVSEDHSEAAQSVLRYELETFVCDGQYEKGIEVVLDKFLLNLDSHNEQPGIWISGFYGSGKSHLAKMLRTLWTDYKFMDGASARSIAKLPDTVAAHLKELSIQGKRHGGLHAAAGKLGAGAGDKVRLALLGIIFKSKGLPEQFNQAQLVLWLKREGLFEPIEAQLQAVGRSLAQELPHMYVSNHLAKALLAVRPGMANSESEARQLLKAQFPQVQDVSNEQMVNAITEALSDGGNFPLTLVVLDEVQQYIGNDVEKAYMVQEVTESLCKHFTGKLLFIGTGQSALSGMPNLMRLMGRFPVPIMLSDVDVENVTRQIILAKKPSTRPLVEQSWRSNLGEISRHLRGTKLEHVTEDEQLMTDDYPILPVRRRFWERVLRTIDTTGIDPLLLRAIRDTNPSLEEHRLLALSGDALQGAVNTAKGKYFEYLVAQKLNAGEQVGPLLLEPGQAAVLAESMNQPGWDLRIVGEDGNTVDYLQLKATDSVGYIKSALERYPDIQILATDDVAHSGLVLDSGITDVDLREHVGAAIDVVDNSLAESFWEHFHPLLPLVAMALYEGHRLAVGAQSMDDFKLEGASLKRLRWMSLVESESAFER